MRIGRRRLADSIRSAAMVSACLALVAMTGGLLLAIHLLSINHTEHHDSPECSICQQLLVAPQKATLVPSVELLHSVPSLPTDEPELTERVESRHLRTSPPRGPPCSYRSQSA